MGANMSTGAVVGTLVGALAFFITGQHHL